MATRIPLVLVDGQITRLAAGDDISGATATQDVTMTNGNAGAITVGMAVYVSAAGTVDKARANASATSKVLGLVASASIAAASSGSIRYGGSLTSADWTAVIGATTLTAGAIYYLDAATAGKLTATAPDTTNQYVVRVGVALSTTEMLIEVNPPMGA